MVDKRELKSLLRDLGSESIATLKEEHEIILKNLDDLETVLEQAISIIRRIRRIRTTRSRQPHSLREEIPPQERQMPEIVEGV